jgi:hypothetical protein
MPNTPSNPTHSRRFLFHGHAAALGGRIIREGDGREARPVEDGFIDFPGSSLTVVGGRSTASLSPGQITHPTVKKFIRFKTASSNATGEYDNPAHYFAASLKKRDRGTLRTTTTVRTEVLGLDVGVAGEPRMQVDGVRGGFTSRSASDGRETPVRLDPDTGFDGNRITFYDGSGRPYALNVEMDLRAFNTYPTLSALLEAAGSLDFVRKFGPSLFLAPPKAATGARQGAAKSLLRRRARLRRTDAGAVIGTIVRTLEWEGEPFPGSEIEPEHPNRVRIPGLGLLSLGEIVIDKQARRITMIRGDLGSYMGAELAVCDYQDNGGFS